MPLVGYSTHHHQLSSALLSVCSSKSSLGILTLPPGYEFNMKQGFAHGLKAAYRKAGRKANTRTNFLRDRRTFVCFSFGGKPQSVFVKIHIGLFTPRARYLLGWRDLLSSEEFR